MLKRGFDLLAIVVSAPIWLPVMALVALLVRIKLGPPILFRQQRPGKSAKIFELVKFRTMLDSRDESGRPLPDAERVTSFGQWLRSTSLDELPELWNVLKGEMSLVGPRPLLVQYLDRYSPRQSRRHNVQPGLTGLAQVMGRNALTWEEKFEWDVRYVERRSLWLDLKILALTITTVFYHRGVNAKGEVTMPEFDPAGSRRSTPH